MPRGAHYQDGLDDHSNLYDWPLVHSILAIQTGVTGLNLPYASMLSTHSPAR